MKKAIVILLAILMLVAVAACGGGTTTSPSASAPPASSAPPPSSAAPPPSTSPTTPAAPPSTAPTKAPEGAGVDPNKPYPNANADGSINLDTIGHYDQTYDYTKNPKYKIAYIAQSSNPLYQMSADAYEAWCPAFNCEWAGFLSANADTDLYLTLLQNAIDQGVKGFILDPDNTIFPAVINIMNQHPDCAWLSQMAPPRDGATGNDSDGNPLPIGGNLINNYVGFNNVDAGAQQVYKLVEWKNANLADVSWDDIGVLAMGFSTSPPLQERVIGAQQVFTEVTGKDATEANGFFVADVSAAPSGMTLQGAVEAAGPIITTNSYKHWLVMGLIDDFAQGAASILDQQGLTDGSCVVTFGGSNLIEQWRAGQQDAFRYALFTAQSLYAEPIFGGVYAFLNGWATPESIWPSWVKWDDHGGAGNTYSQLRLPTEWLSYDDYQVYLKWTDMYTGQHHYDDFPSAGVTLDLFSPFADVPADFAKP